MDLTDAEISGIIRRYHASMFRLAFSYLKNREDAEDIVQEAFLRLYSSNVIFPAEENIKAWLIRVTINLCKDLLRSKKRRAAEPITDIPTEDSKVSELLDCIRRLKPEYAAIIYLFYYEGYSVKEIAKIQGISDSAVTTRLARARKQLKKMLTKEGL